MPYADDAHDSAFIGHRTSGMLDAAVFALGTTCETEHARRADGVSRCEETVRAPGELDKSEAARPSRVSARAGADRGEKTNNRRARGPRCLCVRGKTVRVCVPGLSPRKKGPRALRNKAALERTGLLRGPATRKDECG